MHCESNSNSNSKKLLLIFLVIFSISLVSCGSTSDDSDNGDGDTSDGDTSDGDTADGDVNDTAYPEGPYGYELGDTMANFKLTNCAGDEVELKDFFGKAKAVLINHSAGWCSVCRAEAKTLENWYQSLKDKGVVILMVLFENNTAAPANQDFCKAWQDQYDLTMPVLIDPENIFYDYHPSIQAGGATYATPLSIVLDENMKINYLLEGDIPTSIFDRLNDLIGGDK